MNRTPSAGYFPESGAIFIANKDTRKECLQRKLFGLPRESEDFVLKVKSGMLLFLFEYTDRMLYGVFEATSDGGMNLVRDAYKSRFPAQVRFHILWECDPIPENAFYKAIADNYCTEWKFNLGLSRDQVRRLLNRFEKSKRNIQPSRSSVKMNLPQLGNGQCQDVCGLTLIETLPKAMPKRLASLVVCDPVTIAKNIDAKDSVDDNCQYTDPVEMLLAQYEEYLSRSRSEELIQPVSVEENVKLENFAVDIRKGSDEFHSS